MDDDRALAAQSRERRDDGCEFHLVVGRELAAAVHFPGMRAPDHVGAPASDAGVALAGAVGPDFQCLFGLLCHVRMLRNG